MNLLWCSVFVKLCVCFSKVSGCEDGWSTHGSKCYHFSHDTEAWPDAATICQMFGGYLVEIDDVIEEQYLVSQAKLTGKNYWIGLNDLQEEGTWEWSNSKTTLTQGSYSNWSHGQPDNAKDNENCCEIGPSFQYLWNDAPCHILLYYICEKQAESTEIIG